MHHFLMGVFSWQISLCRNFHSKVGVGVISDVGIISVEYGISHNYTKDHYSVTFTNAYNQYTPSPTHHLSSLSLSLYSYTLECNYNSGRQVNSMSEATLAEGRATPPHPGSNMPHRFSIQDFEQVSPRAELSNHHVELLCLC